MRNLVLVGLLSLSFIACSKSGGNSCNANASIIAERRSETKVINLIKSENKVIIEKDAKEKVLLDRSYYFLDSGEKFSFSGADDSEESDESNTVIDFNKNTIGDEERTMSFTRNSSKGEGWYSVDAAQLKSILQGLRQVDGSENIKICSLESVEMNFKVDEKVDTSLSEMKMIMRVQLSDVMASHMKENKD